MSSPVRIEAESPESNAVFRSRSSDPLRSSKRESPSETKKSHFHTLKQWGKNRLKMINRSSDSAKSTGDIDNKADPADINIYETVSVRRKRNGNRDKRLSHERKPSYSSSEKSSINLPMTTAPSAAMNIAVKLREGSAQSRQRRSGDKDEPHSSSGNWSASSESGRASIGSEITNSTAQPKSSTSAATSSNSLNLHPPSSVNSRRKFNINTSGSSSIASDRTITPDIHDFHEDGETSSVYSCDTEGYYTSFHMDSGLKTLKEEDSPATPLHSTTVFSSSSSGNTLTAENEYELFGKGSTSTTASSAGTVCTTFKASGSRRSLILGPAVPERKSSLCKSISDKSPGSSLEREFDSDKTGTVKRSPANMTKATVVAVVHKQSGSGDVSPDSGHNTSSSPIESHSANSPNGGRSGSEFEFSECSDMEGADRIERIRVKTTINSSRIPSMCVITPPHSDDESIKNEVTCSKMSNRQKLTLPLKPFETDLDKLDFADDNEISRITEPHVSTTVVDGRSKMHLINVNSQSGYATVETVNVKCCEITNKQPISTNTRAPSPSGGSVTIRNVTLQDEEIAAKPQSQPILKATLLPLNNMFGRIKSNLSNLALKKEHKAVVPRDADDVLDSGEYVTIADVRNNNEKAPITTQTSRNSELVSENRIKEVEYICLNELPCNNMAEDASQSSSSTSDSLERRRKGARVTLDSEGKVIYSSDSLKRRKGAHTTFEPGPYVKDVTDPTASPLPSHRTPAIVRPVHSTVHENPDRPLSPQVLQQEMLVIRASSGVSSPTAEIVRVPPANIVGPNTRPLSPKLNNSKCAYVHIQDSNTSALAHPKGKNSPAPRIVNALPKLNNNNHAEFKISSRKIKRSDSYRMANSAALKLSVNNRKLELEDLIEKEFAAELLRERINYPPSVSPKLCARHCQIYSQDHAREMLLASPNRVTIPGDSAEHRARVLSASVADTEIW